MENNDSLAVALARRGNRQTCPAVFICRADRVIIGLRHYTPDKFKDISLWTTPGGRCDDGETVEETLRRETHEEVGLDDLRITAFLGDVPGAKEGDVVPVFVGETAGEPTLMEPEKFSEWRWQPLDDIPHPFINPAALSLVRQWVAANDTSADEAASGQPA